MDVVGGGDGDGDWHLKVLECDAGRQVIPVCAEVLKALSREPQLNATTHGRDLVSNEPMYTASVRLVLSGHRHLVMVRAQDVLEAIESDGGTRQKQGSDAVASCPSFQDWLWTGFGQMSRTALAAFAQKHDVVSATQGPGDLLFMPAGWMCAEENRGTTTLANANSDVIALKVGLFHSACNAAAALWRRVAEEAGCTKLDKEACEVLEHWRAKMTAPAAAAPAAAAAAPAAVATATTADPADPAKP